MFVHMVPYEMNMKASVLVLLLSYYIVSSISH